MIMPFLRLVIIYIVVILATLLVFKRDQVMALVGMSGGGAETEMTATADAPTKVAEPIADMPVTSTPEATASTDEQPEATTEVEQPPKYPTEETAQIGTPADPAPAPVPAPTVATPAEGIQSRLAEARQTYWNRDLARAETLYKSLVADAPTNADIKGELGNLYFAQRRMNEAADMYHQTGLQLISDGNTQQIMQLVGVLQSIAPDKAADLRSRLSQ